MTDAYLYREPEPISKFFLRLLRVLTYSLTLSLTNFFLCTMLSGRQVVGISTVLCLFLFTFLSYRFLSILCWLRVCYCALVKTTATHNAGLYNKAVNFLTPDLPVGAALPPDAAFSASAAPDVLRIRQHFPETWIWPEELIAE